MIKIKRSLPVIHCDISVRARNVLCNNSDLFGVEIVPGYPEVLTVGHLATGSKRELRHRRGAGNKTLKEIEDLCSRAGIKMKD